MTMSIAARTIVQAVTTPTDKEQAKKDMKLLRRKAKRAGSARAF